MNTTFFDRNGQVNQRGGKQVDPVNFGRLTAGPPDPRDLHPRDNEPDQYFGPMRRRIHAYAKTLIALRTTAPALAVNDTDFIWTDFGEGKRVIVWRRGGAAAPVPVIVLANFSDFTPVPGTEYVIFCRIADQFLALVERFVQSLDRQLAGVKLTLSPNRRTVTVDPNPTSGNCAALLQLVIGRLRPVGYFGEDANRLAHSATGRANGMPLHSGAERDA
jgi:hypothetical protein